MTHHFRTFLPGVLATFLVVSAAARADGQDQVHRGHEVALHICATCHAAERGQTLSPYKAAPPFDQIANAPAMTKLALRVALQSSHRVMPNIKLTDSQRADVIVYIVTLKRERPRGD